MDISLRTIKENSHFPLISACITGPLQFGHWDRCNKNVRKMSTFFNLGRMNANKNVGKIPFEGRMLQKWAQGNVQKIKVSAHKCSKNVRKMSNLFNFGHFHANESEFLWKENVTKMFNFFMFWTQSLNYSLRKRPK
jgi:hypothetical protein